MQYIAHMDTTGTKKRLTGAVNFRAEAKMVADIMDYQAKRKLPRFADASREVMEIGLEFAALIAEARHLGIDPVQALRERIAQEAGAGFQPANNP